jgi:hypothetical protein
MPLRYRKRHRRDRRVIPDIRPGEDQVKVTVLYAWANQIRPDGIVVAFSEPVFVTGPVAFEVPGGGNLLTSELINNQAMHFVFDQVMVLGDGWEWSGGIDPANIIGQTGRTIDGAQQGMVAEP